MRAVFLAAVLLAAAAPLAHARGSLGHLFGVQGVCPNDFCWNIEMYIKNCSLPDDFGGPQAMGPLLPMSDRWNYPLLGRYNTYDNSTGRYFFLEADGTLPPPVTGTLYRLFTVDLAKWAAVGQLSVTNVTLSFALKDSDFTSIQYDDVSKKLFGVLDNNLVTIDETTGVVTTVGPIWTASAVVPTLTTAYDSASHQYFIVVVEASSGYRRVLVYNTQTGATNLVAAAGVNTKTGFQEGPYMMQYWKAQDQIVAVANGNMGVSIQAIDYKTGDWKYLVGTDAFPNDAYSMQEPTPYYNELSFIDQERQYFWFNLEDQDEYGTIMYLDLTKPNICCYDYDTLADDFTNYLWIANYSNLVERYTRRFPSPLHLTTSAHTPAPTARGVDFSLKHTKTQIRAPKPKTSASKPAEKSIPIQAPALPQGYFLTVYVDCSTPACDQGTLQLAQVQQNRTTQITNIAQILPLSQSLSLDALGRIATLDTATGRFLLVLDRHTPTQRYTLYSIVLGASPVVKSLVLDAALNSKTLTSIQYDAKSFLLFAAVDQAVYVIDETSGAATMLGGFAPDSSQKYQWIFPNYYISTFDSNLGNYFISVYDLWDDTYKLLTFNTRTNASTLSPAIGLMPEKEADGAVDVDVALYRIFQYYAPLDQIVAVADSNRWDGSIELIDYKTGTWRDVLDRFTWPYEQYELLPPSEIRNQQYYLQDDVLWFDVGVVDTEGDYLIVSYNLTTLLNYDYALEDASTVSIDWTNFFYSAMPVV